MSDLHRSVQLPAEILDLGQQFLVTPMMRFEHLFLAVVGIFGGMSMVKSRSIPDIFPSRREAG